MRAFVISITKEFKDQKEDENQVEAIGLKGKLSDGQIGSWCE